MKKSGRAAVAQYSTRGKQELVILRQADDVLIMQTVHYADEINSASEIDRGETGVPREGELDRAVQLIDQLASSNFVPDRYEDQYRKKVLELIDHKVAGKEVATAPAAAPKAQIIDLMEALKA